MKGRKGKEKAVTVPVLLLLLQMWVGFLQAAVMEAALVEVVLLKVLLVTVLPWLVELL